jgi:hypothetical protein
MLARMRSAWSAIMAAMLATRSSVDAAAFQSP